LQYTNAASNEVSKVQQISQVLSGSTLSLPESRSDSMKCDQAPPSGVPTVSKYFSSNALFRGLDVAQSIPSAKIALKRLHPGYEVPSFRYDSKGFRCDVDQADDRFENDQVPSLCYDMTPESDDDIVIKRKFKVDNDKVSVSHRNISTPSPGTYSKIVANALQKKSSTDHRESGIQKPHVYNI
jgi:hypothetical protein